MLLAAFVAAQAILGVQHFEYRAPRLLHKVSADAKEAGPDATTPT
jgi:hypothetical protein